MSFENEIFIPNQKARKKLAEKLNLKFDENSQDWEWEISDSSRIDEFITEYDNQNSSQEEKEILMEIILDSLNDMGKIDDGFEKYLISILFRLKKNSQIHKGTISYWTKGSFEISHLLKL